MPSQMFTITELNRTITPGFLVKQIKIENPTPFYLYLNLSTYSPTPVASEYVISPNSTVITPEVTTLSISLLASGVNSSKGVAKVTVYDLVNQQAATLPYQSSQFIGNFPGYPYQWNDNNSVQLPDVKIERFQNVYFLARSRALEVNVYNVTPFFLFGNHDSSEISFLVGGFNPVGGLVSYSPMQIPETLRLFTSSHSGSVYSKELNIVQSAEPIKYVSNPSPYQLSANPGGSATIYVLGNAPGIIINAIVFGVGIPVLPVSLDFTISIASWAFPNQYADLFTTSFVGNVSANPPDIYMLIRSKVFPLGDSYILRYVLNNTGVNTVNVNVRSGTF